MSKELLNSKNWNKLKKTAQQWWATFCFPVIMLLCFSLPALAQEKQTITLQVKDTSISEVLNMVEKQSQYSFLYNKNEVDVSKTVTLSLKKASMKETLNKLFAHSNITYEFDRNYVILKKVKKTVSRKTVKGRITDKHGEPMAGATIADKDGKTGVISDMDGNYMITVSAGSVLSYQFIGYETTEVKVDDYKNVIDVILIEAAQGLDEVVVIGYGTAQKKDLTGSVSSVMGSRITDRKVAQLSTALQGAMSGVTVTRTNNAPGAQSAIRIRGITTIGESSPLVIVDGVPADNINDINPNDVESITALKDAASAAIYGSRAASGVIIVTTKRAKTNQLSLEYSYEFGIDKPTARPDFVDVQRFMEMTNELRWKDAGNGSDEYPTYAATTIDNYMEYNRENPDKYPNTNWRNVLLKNKATKQTHSFSIAGGTEHIRTKATFGYDYADGLYNNRDYERFTVRMNNDIKINKYISAAFDISVKRSSYTKPTYDPMDASNLFPQVYAATWSDGRIADGKSGDNPYAKLHYGGNKKEYYNQVSGKIALYLTPVKGLKLSAVLSPIYNDSRTKEFRKRIEYFSAENPNELIGAITDYGSTQLSESRGNKQSITKQLFANYDCTLGNHTLTLLLGYEDNTYKTEDLKASRDHFELTQYPYLDRGSSDYQFNNGNAKHTAYRSTFGRIMYNYNNRYLLQANLRSDSSSRFDKKHRIGYFPSISGGWVISEEPFFKDLHIKPLSFLKFRASYGLLGNDRVGEYPYLPLLAYSDQLFYEGNNVTSYLTAAQWQYAIRNISWETTKTFGLGLDVALLDGRLRLTADYYYKITKDMILDVDIPDYVGYDNPQQNTGKMKTTGFEIEMSWNDHINDFHYGISANLSDYRSKMGYLGGNQFLGDRIKRMGSYFNEWYGYRTDGIFQTSEEIANTPVMNNNVKPGDIKYLKADPTDNSPISPDRDRVLLGNSQPRFLYGATLNADYKGFDLNISMQGIGKQLQCKKTEMVQPLRNNFGAIPRLIDGKYWSNYNTPEQNAEAKYPRLTSTQSGHNYAMSDFWLFNGAYFRLKNITVGYTVPKHLTEKLSIKSLRIYLSANDILCFSKYPKGWDPENSSDVIGGTDNKDFYPITRSILGGINIKF